MFSLLHSVADNYPIIITVVWVFATGGIVAYIAANRFLLKNPLGQVALKGLSWTSKAFKLYKLGNAFAQKAQIGQDIKSSDTTQQKATKVAKAAGTGALSLGVEIAKDFVFGWLQVIALAFAGALYTLFFVYTVIINLWQLLF